MYLNLLGIPPIEILDILSHYEIRQNALKTLQKNARLADPDIVRLMSAVEQSAAKLRRDLGPLFNTDELEKAKMNFLAELNSRRAAVREQTGLGDKVPHQRRRFDDDEGRYFLQRLKLTLQYNLTAEGERAVPWTEEIAAAITCLIHAAFPDYFKAMQKCNNHSDQAERMLRKIHEELREPLNILMPELPDRDFFNFAAPIIKAERASAKPGRKRRIA
jgi:hypothetical protein